MKAVILFNQVSCDSPEDEQDVLVQMDHVSKALTKLGYEVEHLPLSLNLLEAREALLRFTPEIVFNLVESIGGAGRFIYFAPALLEELRLPFTGASSEALYLTTNKLLAKERLRAGGIPTPPWAGGKEILGNNPGIKPPFIIKPVNEDASVGLDEEAIVSDVKHLPSVLAERMNRYGECFAELYIHGREFNISLLAGSEGPEVLPPAEMTFQDYPEGKPWLVGYEAKWDSSSFEYHHTVRSFDFNPEDNDLIDRLREISLRCWNLFSLRGYARVDIRVDAAGNPFVLEVNANPCISPDSGFIAAGERAALPYDKVIERILEDSLGVTNVPR